MDLHQSIMRWTCIMCGGGYCVGHRYICNGRPMRSRAHPSSTRAREFHSRGTRVPQPLARSKPAQALQPDQLPLLVEASRGSSCPIRAPFVLARQAARRLQARRCECRALRLWLASRARLDAAVDGFVLFGRLEAQSAGRTLRPLHTALASERPSATLQHVAMALLWGRLGGPGGAARRGRARPFGSAGTACRPALPGQLRLHD
jgi:hypothetical protein